MVMGGSSYIERRSARSAHLSTTLFPPYEGMASCISRPRYRCSVLFSCLSVDGSREAKLAVIAAVVEQCLASERLVSNRRKGPVISAARRAEAAAPVTHSSRVTFPRTLQISGGELPYAF